MSAWAIWVAQASGEVVGALTTFSTTTLVRRRAERKAAALLEERAVRDAIARLEGANRELNEKLITLLERRDQGRRDDTGAAS